MEKAIEIKRRAQRCILNGDLDGALSEYEKLVASGDSDPYHSVLLADLLYKKKDPSGATRRYLEAIDGYERVSLFKNAIAVCKKMTRLNLAPEKVLKRLANLHALDGLATEATLYYMQHAELVLKNDQPKDAIESLRLAHQVCPDNVKALERLADVQEIAGDREGAGRSLYEAAHQYELTGQTLEARRCQTRAEKIAPGLSLKTEAPTDGASVAGESALAEDPGVSSVASSLEVAPPSLAATPIESEPEASEPSAIEPVSAFSIASPLDDELGATPARPGLAFDAPAASSKPSTEPAGLPEVSVLLNEAQALFQKGDRDAATDTLVRAAQTYDHLGRFDSAASIYRSLSRARSASLQVMMLWLKNCQRRSDPREAASVACELGDRALQEDDVAGAREWFERARAFDGENPTAARRLERMNAARNEPPSRPAAPATPAPAAAAEKVVAQAEGAAALAERTTVVEVKLENADPVGMELGSIIAEFQRGLDEQLDCDPQGHYDLAMSYREMGLHDQAIESFRVAARDVAFRVKSAEMIGRCLLERGDFDEAVAEFRGSLQYPELAMNSSLDLRFQLGLALEAAGRPHEALDEFEKIYTADPSFPDAASKIRGLRKSLEQQ